MDYQLLIYLAIFVIWMIARFFQEVKKHRQEQQQPQEEVMEAPYPVQPSGKKLQRQVYRAPEGSLETIEPEIKKVKKKKSQRSRFADSLGFGDYAPAEATIKADEPIRSYSDEREKFNIDFDLRKAIIFSAILKRPDY